MMRNKHMIRTLAVLLAVMLCMTAFSTVAFASDGEAATTSEAQTEPTDSADITGDDLSKLISALFGSVLGSTEKSGKTGTVTTNGGKLNVRTGAGLDNYAFTQLPNGTVVEVVGTDGDWYMIRLPEKIGYVYSGYMTLSDTGGENDGNFSFSIDPDKLSELFEQLMGGSGGAALTPDGNLSLIDDIGSSTRSGKQFITVETKNGNVFYLIIDRDDEGEETTEPVAEQEMAGDVSDLLSALAGSQVTVSVTEDGIQFSSGENDSEQTGTVTTGGGNLNVRTGAGMDYTAFAQLPNGTTVKVIGTDGDWLKVILPEKIGYVYSGYMTVSDGEAGSGEGSFSLDAETLENLLGMLGGGLNGGAALTPDGNLSLIDDIGSPTTSGKQFITVETKNGNVFYLIIDRDDEGEETVHFLNQVDEADLMALTEDGEKAETPIVCTCTEKCQAGAVNTTCPVCVKNLSECVGTEQKAAEPTEPENLEPEKKSNTGAILAVLLILAAGGGAAVYFLVLKPKQGKKVTADLDDFDLEDEEEYLTEDEETEEKNE